MRRLAVGAALAGMWLSPAGADDYPSRPVTLVIPFTAGGPADTAARTFSEVLRHHLGQSVVAENRPAASGITGTEAVARGEADGYTLLLGGIAVLALIPLPPQDAHLMSKGNELKIQGGTATKPEGEDGNDGGKNRDHAQDRTAMAQESVDFLGLSEL
jgi:hypothetical protein